MIEAFLVAIVIFVAYIVYTIIIQPNQAAAKAAALKPTNKPATAKTSQKEKPAAKPKKVEKPAAKPKATEKAAAEAAPAGDSAVTVLLNPKTKETANVPNNYRFAKRWIKEALVEEGLLDKVYKNNELDDAASIKVKEAINKLKAIKKYQA